MPVASRSVIFDRFRFIVPTRELLRIGNDGSSVPIPLGSRAAEILHLFLQRHGELVSRNELIAAVWPHTVAEENNLTAQISALRRALDDGHHGGSCIQTVQGRGYRFTPRIMAEEGTGLSPSIAGAPAPDGTDAVPDVRHLSPQSVPAVSSPGGVGRVSGNRRLYRAGAVGLLCAAVVAFGWHGFRADPPTRRADPPRLSIVVLPFANASGTPKDEELAAALTDDFMAYLVETPGSVVVARSTAQAMVARKLPLPAVGRELRVRYVLEGNIRRSPEGIEVNVQLSDAASSTSIWARQFKEAASEPGDLRLQVTQSSLFPLRTALMDAEARRISSLPDAALTGDDLLLKVGALNNHLPVTPAKNAESIGMLERASALNPSSAEVMISLADQILRPSFEFGDLKTIDERLLRARTLAERARALAADSESMLALQARILRAEGRLEEALAAYALIRSSGRFRVDVAWCLIHLGRSAEAVPLLEEAIRLDHDMEPRYRAYFALGVALIRIGRYEEAISRLRAANEASSGASPQISWHLAIAYVHAERVSDARRELLEYRKQWGSLPTARWMRQAVRLPLAEDYGREVDELFLALLPDHVSEDADTGLPMTEGVRSANLFGRMTPIGAPGVSTIKTSELRALIGDGEGGASGELPLLLSTNCSNCLRVAIPGTNFVPDAYRNGMLDDAKRQALKILVDRLLHGDRTRRVITSSWNAAFWDARNLAIELAALGYSNVSWYRGGLEAWDVAGLPVTRLK
jgi:adenylate cyclase